MRRLWVSLFVILLLAALALSNVRYLDGFTSSLTEQLEQAQKSAETGDTALALQLTVMARDSFLHHSLYLHITLDHKDIDSIHSAFGEALEYLRSGETGGIYAAANSALLAKIGLLAEAEQLSLKNVL